MENRRSVASLFHSIASILISVFLLGCSASGPSEDAGRKVVQNQINKESQGLVKLISFRKINGVATPTEYKMDYEVVIEFLDTAQIIKNAQIYGPFWATPGEIQMWDTMREQKRKGDRSTRKGTLTFEKRDNGWKGPDENFY